MKTKSALPYFGSESEVAAQLGAMFDGCRHVTIPFVGGAAILPHLTAKAIICNDLNDYAINFYRCLSGTLSGEARSWLLARCSRTLSHPAELTEALHLLHSESLYARAWAYWALSWLPRKGRGGTDAMLNPSDPSMRWTADGGNNATRLRAAVEDLDAWAEHFKRCEWTSLDFREVLDKAVDREENGIYIDPPWVGAGDAYLHNFGTDDHFDLRNELACFIKARIVVRYGDNTMIRELYKDWNIIEATSRTQSNAVKGELWITRNAPMPW